MGTLKIWIVYTSEEALTGPHRTLNGALALTFLTWTVQAVRGWTEIMQEAAVMLAEAIIKNFAGGTVWRRYCVYLSSF